MNRRQFIIFLAMVGLRSGTGTADVLAKNLIEDKNISKRTRIVDGQQRYKVPSIDSEVDACPVPPDIQAIIREKEKNKASRSSCLAPLLDRPVKVRAKEYQAKMRLFNKPHPEDLYVLPDQRPLFKSCLKRFNRIYRIVGHTNFYLLSMDDALKLARGYTRVGRFTTREIEYLESVFDQDAAAYGFYGKKLITNFTGRQDRSKVAKIRGTGNYLIKGSPVTLYKRLREDIGTRAILTSGVRGIVKQFHLFFRKVNANRGNLSLASRSIAPPGYSYHGIGDFDVGQVGLGGDNFTVRFIRSRVFKELLGLDYICLRYTEDNPYGVRFEPWHVMTRLSG
ncbi:MAG: hypothetical protein DSY90_01850 [Deltaproteobacteria bacterium]|nr:MAG: hypothetical protein DSY90_01850 [Deltaproteobacteria bacterium]RTZ99368.1 MAG: hypothetical protein DSY89_08525 [Deltaproteobacteria bacterium]